VVSLKAARHSLARQSLRQFDDGQTAAVATQTALLPQFDAARYSCAWYGELPSDAGITALCETYSSSA
jgi:hypothetical protein